MPKGIMVHSTGSENPWIKRYVGPDDGLLGVNSNGNHWNCSGLSVCVHAFIGKLKDGSIATYQTLPWTYRGWHAGGSANNTHIGFEICEDGLSDADYFAKVYNEAIELSTYLCYTYSINPLTGIICHSEGYTKGIASGHADVMHWFPKHGKSMDTFRAEVNTALTKLKAAEATKVEALRIVKLVASSPADWSNALSGSLEGIWAYFPALIVKTYNQRGKTTLGYVEVLKQVTSSPVEWQTAIAAQKTGILQYTGALLEKIYKLS